MTDICERYLQILLNVMVEALRHLPPEDSYTACYQIDGAALLTINAGSALRLMECCKTNRSPVMVQSDTLFFRLNTYGIFLFDRLLKRKNIKIL